MALVCLCYGVNERRLRREIDHGATTIEEIADRCQAGSCCQGCHPTIDALIAERCALAARSRSVATVAGWRSVAAHAGR